MDVALYTLRQGRGGELTLSCVGSEGVGVGDKISAAACKRTRRPFNKCLPKFCAGSMTLIKHHVNECLSSLTEDIPDN